MKIFIAVLKKVQNCSRYCNNDTQWILVCWKKKKKVGTIKSNLWKGFRFLNFLPFVYSFINNEAFQPILLLKKSQISSAATFISGSHLGYIWGHSLRLFFNPYLFFHFHFHEYEPKNLWNHPQFPQQKYQEKERKLCINC